MPRYATVLKFTSSDGSTVVDFSGCRGYLRDTRQFGDDDIRETRMPTSDGTPFFLGLIMGANPHRGNLYGIEFEAAVQATKLAALQTLNKDMRAAGSFMKVSLTDALITLTNIPSKGDPDANPFWIASGDESEGMIEKVQLRLIALG